MYEGKKVFFILPPELVKEHIIKILSDNEYEVYVINDQRVIEKLASRFPDSIMYINIDGTLREEEWKEKIRGLTNTYADLRVGVLSGRISDVNMANSFIMESGVTAGVIRLRQGLKESSDTMLKVLEVNEARGRRKYLRYKCPESDSISLNFSWFNKIVKGHIIDISSVGLSCYFDDTIEIAKNQVIPSVQLKLGPTLITTDCIAIGSRDDGGVLIYVFLFRTSNETPIKSKIRHFINNSLQKELDKSL